MQVDVELAVGKATGQPMGGVDGQGGLADPAGPFDRADHYRARTGCCETLLQVRISRSRPVKLAASGGS